MLPLYEAKMLHLYDTRWATYEPDGSSRSMTESEKAAHELPMPRYWVHEADVDRKMGRESQRPRLLGWRRICRATDARTLICTQVPKLGFGDSWFLALPARGMSVLQAVFASFVLDYVARQKLGGTNMNFFTFMQLPMPHPNRLGVSNVAIDRRLDGWIDLRVDRLNGWIADPDERAAVRAEIDALMFHLFGLDREAVSYVMDTFPIVGRKDEAVFGDYRTKKLILAAYDEMSRAPEAGAPQEPAWTEEGRS